MTPEDIQSRVLYKDQLVIALNKPVGIPVHAGPNGGESLEDYFDLLSFGYKEIPKLAHRLDRDTSGCLLLGRNDRALRKLGKLFETGKIKKTYWAITEGIPQKPEGIIDTPLKKVKLPKGWSMETAKPNDAKAEKAVTEYKIINELSNNRCFIELKPQTGRTHQIRVHLQSLGCPIVGDWLYGLNPQRPDTGTFPTLHLHARSLLVPLYDQEQAISVTAQPPAHMLELIGKNHPLLQL
jgi:tRNA pseudouridine32 synthase/23S rRNA pseudouridine746 synthase